jgi:hypothetical protein
MMMQVNGEKHIVLYRNLENIFPSRRVYNWNTERDYKAYNSSTKTSFNGHEIENVYKMWKHMEWLSFLLKWNGKEFSPIIIRETIFIMNYYCTFHLNFMESIWNIFSSFLVTDSNCEVTQRIVEFCSKYFILFIFYFGQLKINFTTTTSEACGRTFWVLMFFSFSCLTHKNIFRMRERGKK